MTRLAIAITDDGAVNGGAAVGVGGDAADFLIAGFGTDGCSSHRRVDRRI